MSAPAAAARRTAPHVAGRAAPARPDRLLPTPDLSGAAGQGISAMLPVLLGYVPFGLVVGSAVAASPEPLAAWLGTSTIYGGAAQLAVLDVIAAGGGVAAAAGAGLLLNARVGVYAAALAPDWRTASLRSRVLAALTLTDSPWAMAEARRTSGTDVADRRRFYLAAALTLWLGWPVVVTVGALTGTLLLAVPGAGLVAPVLFAALLVPHLRAPTGVVTVLAAGTTAAATWQLDAGVALPLVAAAGTAAAMAHGRRQR